MSGPAANKRSILLFSNFRRERLVQRRAFMSQFLHVAKHSDAPSAAAQVDSAQICKSRSN